MVRFPSPSAWLAAVGAIVVAAGLTGDAQAQGQFGDRAVGGSIGGVDRGGTTQSGTVSSSAAIQRTDTGFVGAGAGGGLGDIRGGGTATGAAAGRGLGGGGLGGGLGGLGGGLGGFGGGLGGFGGGLGGFGGGFGGGLGGFGGGLGAGGRGGAQQRGVGGQRGGLGQAPQMKISYRIGFRTSRTVTAKALPRFTARLSRLPRFKNFASSIQIQMDGNTAVLTGRVASAADRDLMAQLVQLEPGVEAVRNELTAADADSPDGPSPTPGPSLPAPANR